MEQIVTTLNQLAPNKLNAVTSDNDVIVTSVRADEKSDSNSVKIPSSILQNNSSVAGMVLTYIASRFMLASTKGGDLNGDDVVSDIKYVVSFINQKFTPESVLSGLSSIDESDDKSEASIATSPNIA